MLVGAGWKKYIAAASRLSMTFLLATALPRKDHVLKLTVLAKSEKAEGNTVRIGGFCATNPQAVK
jgi:hypothetical protein